MDPILSALPTRMLIPSVSVLSLTYPNRPSSGVCLCICVLVFSYLCICMCVCIFIFVYLCVCVCVASVSVSDLTAFAAKPGWSFVWWKTRSVQEVPRRQSTLINNAIRIRIRQCHCISICKCQEISDLTNTIRPNHNQL